MGFFIFCEHKGCRKEMEPVLDKETNTVHCTECDGEIKNITSFTKNQMPALGMVRKSTKGKQAFAVKCTSCKEICTPSFNKEKNVICGNCSGEISNLSAPFIQALKIHLKVK